MAGNDSININIGDGTTIAVPKWAQEITADTIVHQLKLGNKFQKDLLKNLSDLTIDVKDFEKELTGIFERLKRRQEQIAEEEAKSRRKFAKDIAKKTSDIVNDLSDTSKPLTKMTELTGAFGSALGDMTGSFLKDSKALGAAGEMFKKAMPGLNLAGDALMAYVGFQAGRIEQFAAAQKSMIDAGAIYYESAAEFDKLYQNASAAGITYTQLANIAAGYGTALQSLGTGVSSGTKAFSEFFKDINETSDKFGDFGMSSENLANTYAEFIDVQRLTGSINRDTIGVQDKLRQGFQELMLETTALASLTGKNRNEMLQRQMAALKDPRNAAALIKMREAGLVDQADAAEQIIKQFASGTEEFGQVGATLSNALAEELSTTKDNIEDFDIGDVLRQTDRVLYGVLQEHAPDFLSGINDAVRTGQVEGDNLGTFVYDQFMGMREALADQDIFQGAVGPSNEYAKMVLDLQNIAILTEKTFGNVKNMTDAELAAFQDQTGKNAGEAGKATVAVNDLITTFLEVQNALTYPLNKSADIAEFLSGALKGALDRLKNGGEENNSPPPPTASLDGYDQAYSDALEADPNFTAEPLDLKHELMEYDAGVLARHEEMMRQSGGTTETKQDPLYGTLTLVTTNSGPRWMMPEGRATGGPVDAGETYLVGEQGPEFIEPGMKGNVTSFSKTTEQIKAREAELSNVINTLERFFEMGGNSGYNSNQSMAELSVEDVNKIVDSRIGALFEAIKPLAEVSKLSGMISDVRRSLSVFKDTTSDVVKSYNDNNEEIKWWMQDMLESTPTIPIAPAWTEAEAKAVEDFKAVIEGFGEGVSQKTKFNTPGERRYAAAMGYIKDPLDAFGGYGGDAKSNLVAAESIDAFGGVGSEVKDNLQDAWWLKPVLEQQEEKHNEWTEAEAKAVEDFKAIVDGFGDGASKTKFKTAGERRYAASQGYIADPMDAFGGSGEAIKHDFVAAEDIDAFGGQGEEIQQKPAETVTPSTSKTPRVRSETDVEQDTSSSNKSDADVESMLSEYNELKKTQLEVIKRFKTLMKTVAKSNKENGTSAPVE